LISVVETRSIRSLLMGVVGATTTLACDEEDGQDSYQPLSSTDEPNLYAARTGRRLASGADRNA
jgi:hypothetical protein